MQAGEYSIKIVKHAGSVRHTAPWRATSLGLEIVSPGLSQVLPLVTYRGHSGWPTSTYHVYFADPAGSLFRVKGNTTSVIGGFKGCFFGDGLEGPKDFPADMVESFLHDEFKRRSAGKKDGSSFVGWLIPDLEVQGFRVISAGLKTFGVNDHAVTLVFGRASQEQPHVVRRLGVFRWRPAELDSPWENERRARVIFQRKYDGTRRGYISGALSTITERAKRFTNGEIGVLLSPHGIAAIGSLITKAVLMGPRDVAA